MVRQVSLLRLVSKGITARMSTALYYTLTCLASEAMKLPQKLVLGRYLRRGEGKPACEPQWCSLAVSLQTPVQAKTCFDHLLIPLCCKKGEVGNYRKRTLQQKEIMQMQHCCKIFKAHKFLEAPHDQVVFASVRNTRNYGASCHQKSLPFPAFSAFSRFQEYLVYPVNKLRKTLRHQVLLLMTLRTSQRLTKQHGWGHRNTATYDVLCSCITEHNCHMLLISKSHNTKTYDIFDHKMTKHYIVFTIFCEICL